MLEQFLLRRGLHLVKNSSIDGPYEISRNKIGAEILRKMQRGATEKERGSEHATRRNLVN
jgi:hypothetical protein